MNFQQIRRHRFFRPAMGAGATLLCGLFLWSAPPGRGWVDGSYDYLFRFGSREVTNNVVVILMKDAPQPPGAVGGPVWDRGRHAKLLNRLADDGSALVVMDIKFLVARDPASDQALAQAMKRQQNLVLAAKLERVDHSGIMAKQLTLPLDRFGEAAGSNHWGVAWLTPDETDGIVRRHWPFPSPGSDPSLPWRAAALAGAQLPAEPQPRWLRYYGEAGAWTRLDYGFAFDKPAGFFHNKIVFIGHTPNTPSKVDGEEDEFSTPYTRWTGETCGGVEILATQFLNLVNGDWLQRLHAWVEGAVLALLGIGLGATLGFLSPWSRGFAILVAALVITVSAVLLSHFTHVWFPWLVVVGGQLPCAWLCSWRWRETVPLEMPYTPDYERVHKLGEGGFGEVWLVRSAIGQWQALKLVYRKNFSEERHYHYEFEGIEKYKPVSERHPGLLRVELISHKRPEGYYYYVMELGDSLEPHWQDQPERYLPATLSSRCRQLPQGRLPVPEVARIGVVLAAALHSLHESGLTHRDVKPQNVIFVNGQPKLADLGLVTPAGTPEKSTSQVGTPGYMPPDPEPQGTVQADIYALGMLLYVSSTGKAPERFPELSRTLLEHERGTAFLLLNPVIVKACHPDRNERYQSATEFREALVDVVHRLGSAAAN